MLYDPKWEFDVYDRENFVTWIGQQPNAHYSYTNAENCLAAQYLKAHGVEDYIISVDRLRELKWNTIANPAAGRSTFRAAYIRGRGGRVRHILKSIGDFFHERTR